MKHITLITVFVIGLVIGLVLTLPRASADGPDCPFAYTVRRGDTLSSIAYQAGTNVWHLARINDIWNINLIYPGQVLCLPSPISVPLFTQSSFDLAVRYKFDSTAEPDAMDWTLGRNRSAGKRLRYALTSDDAIQTYSSTQDVRQASTGASPLLWLVRADADGTAYTLVAIGDPQPLLDLQMEIAPTRNIADIIPSPDPDRIADGDCPDTQQPVDKLSLYAKSNVESLKGELVTREDIFIPIDITGIDYHETVQIAGTCYAEIGFALHSTANPEVEGYRLLMVLNDDGTIGPPGSRWRQHCYRWTGGGWWSRWRRGWFGCP